MSALAGALGAALVSMVAGLTRGKKKYAAVEPLMADAQKEAAELRARLSGLMRRDAQAFDAVLAAFRRPQATPAEVAKRERAVEEATLTATRVPLETAEACLKVARWAAGIGPFGQCERGFRRAGRGRAGAGGLRGSAGQRANQPQNLPDSADKQAVAGRVHELARLAEEALTEARLAFQIATERTA